MAGDWIKMRCDLHDDPAVVLISTALNIGEDEVVGKLHRLWCWADKHALDGRAPAITVKWVDRFVGRRGFADAMVLAGWLLFDEKGISFPKFDRHNGASAKRRCADTERKRESRNCPDNSVTNVRNESGQNDDINVTREEKRRDIKPPNPLSESRASKPQGGSYLPWGSGGPPQGREQAEKRVERTQAQIAEQKQAAEKAAPMPDALKKFVRPH